MRCRTSLNFIQTYLLGTESTMVLHRICSSDQSQLQVAPETTRTLPRFVRLKALHALRNFQAKFVWLDFDSHVSHTHPWQENSAQNNPSRHSFHCFTIFFEFFKLFALFLQQTLTCDTSYIVNLIRSLLQLVHLVRTNYQIL